MAQIKCPKCGEIFTVDESDYQMIVAQVRNEVFETQVAEKLETLKAQMRAEQETERAKSQAEIERVKQAESVKQQERIAELEKQIVALQGKVENSENDKKMAVMEEQNKSLEQLRKKDAELSELKNNAETEKKMLQSQLEGELKTVNAQLEFYKDMKMKMSTKMVGESLEQHCKIQYEKFIRPIIPNAYFDKDNTAVEGTKGDFIFKDSEDGVNYISIMFEMKNETDDEGKKHKNEDFFKKLDEDRRKKGCEYAVLVSTLEPENDLYNDGIVDVSHKYDKMYVIRPQFFVPMITLLRNAAKNSVEYQKQLIEAKSVSVDISNFEEKLGKFKDLFVGNLDKAKSSYDKAIDEIDKSIKMLEGVKENLRLMLVHFGRANNNLDGITIRKLTYQNPTMKQMFDEARAANGKDNKEEDPENLHPSEDVTEADF